MIALGADPGLAAFAWAKVCETAGKTTRGYHCSESGVIVTSPRDETFERERQILTTFSLLAGQFSPNLLGIEDFVYRGPQSETKNFTEIRSIILGIRGVLIGAGCLTRVVVVNKNQCNAAIGLRGTKIAKIQVKRALTVLLGDSCPRNEHARDACCAAIAALQRGGR